MEHLNLYLFNLLNAGPGLTGGPLLLATFAADGLIYLVPLILVACWLWQPRQRIALLMAVGGIALALGINQAIGLVFFHPRPFMLGMGHTYLAHAADSSFPSDHMTVLWGLAISFLLHRRLQALGGLILVVALIVAWSRIYLGVHFPLDMLGAIVISTGSALLIRRWTQLFDRQVLPMAERLYRLAFQWAIQRHWVSA